MAKIVIDANIIISAAFGGKPLEATVKAMGKNDVYMSPEIEQELTLVLSKLSQKLTEEQFAYAQDKIHRTYQNGNTCRGVGPRSFVERRKG